MSTRQAFEASKDPSDISDWDVDWSDHLATGEVIATSAWSVSQGLTIDSDTFSDTVAKVWLRHGTPGKVAVLENTITTSGSRTLQRTVDLRIDQK